MAEWEAKIEADDKLEKGLAENLVKQKEVIEAAKKNITDIEKELEEEKKKE